MLINQSKFFLGPMSKNVVDAVAEFSEETDIPFAFIPSRRQIDYDGGYVHNWNTETFYEYIALKYHGIVDIQRDHGGKYQGKTDNGDHFISYAYDCLHFNMIHVDPWVGVKKDKCNFEVGINRLVTDITALHSMNPFIEFEVGTEEAIYPMTANDVDYMMYILELKLPLDIFKKITYIVIQSGTRLEGNRNVGVYSEEKLKGMLEIVKKWGKRSKEHNGDYLPVSQIHDKFALGLDAINIAPELGMIETECYRNSHMDIIKFHDLCYNSRKWEKWIDKDKEFPSMQELMRICGHYVFSTPEFQEIKPKNYDAEVKEKIKIKLKELTSGL